MILEDEPPRSGSVQHATEEEWWTITNSSKQLGQSKNDAQLQMCQMVKVKFDAKEQYCIGTWNVKSKNQGKLEMDKQEIARVNIDILGICELKWTGMEK